LCAADLALLWRRGCKPLGHSRIFERVIASACLPDQFFFPERLKCALNAGCCRLAATATELQLSRNVLQRLCGEGAERHLVAHPLPYDLQHRLLDGSEVVESAFVLCPCIISMDQRTADQQLFQLTGYPKVQAHLGHQAAEHFGPVADDSEGVVNIINQQLVGVCQALIDDWRDELHETTIQQRERGNSRAVERLFALEHEVGQLVSAGAGEDQS